MLLLSGAKTIGFCQSIFCLVCFSFLKYVELQKQRKLKIVNLLNNPTKKTFGSTPKIFLNHLNAHTNQYLKKKINNKRLKAETTILTQVYVKNEHVKIQTQVYVNNEHVKIQNYLQTENCHLYL